MTYKLPSLSKYYKVLYKFDAHNNYMNVETAFVLGKTISVSGRELFIIQKRPHNSGRVDSILLGYIKENNFDIDRLDRAQQTSHLARAILDVHMDSRYNINEFRYTWRCNSNGVILLTRVRVVNNRVYLFQHRREGQGITDDYRNNIILLGDIGHFEPLMMYITTEILGQSPPNLFSEEDSTRPEDVETNEEPVRHNWTSTTYDHELERLRTD